MNWYYIGIFVTWVILFVKYLGWNWHTDEFMISLLASVLFPVTIGVGLFKLFKDHIEKG
jgi:peptidoglycan biosynthesis protein MviN/MurJ (putative lipid II flippase)